MLKRTSKLRTEAAEGGWDNRLVFAASRLGYPLSMNCITLSFIEISWVRIAHWLNVFIGLHFDARMIMRRNAPMICFVHLTNPVICKLG